MTTCGDACMQVMFLVSFVTFALVSPTLFSAGTLTVVQLIGVPVTFIVKFTSACLRSRLAGGYRQVWLYAAREISNLLSLWENARSCIFYHQQPHPSMSLRPGHQWPCAILLEADEAPKSAPKPPWRVYQFHKRNFEGFRARMSSFSDWCLHSHPEDRSVEQNLSNISASIKEAITKFIPSKMTKQKRHLSWIGPAINRLINKRDRAYKRTWRPGKAQHLSA